MIRNALFFATKVLARLASAAVLRDLKKTMPELYTLRSIKITYHYSADELELDIKVENES